MTDEATSAPVRRRGSEWFWRFLSAVMIFVIGWVVWIAYQLNPPPLVTSAAFEAAAKARAARNTEGRIAPAPIEPAANAEGAAPASEPAPPRAPPVNIEKLRLSDTLSDAAASQGARPERGAAK